MINKIKEEPKQVCENCKIEISKWGCGCAKPKEEPKQETLEEAAERILSKEGIKLHPSGLETYLKGNVINAMVEMAKWMQERYSKMDIINITCDTIDYEMRKYAIEQFKKKQYDKQNKRITG